MKLLIAILTLISLLPLCADDAATPSQPLTNYGKFQTQNQVVIVNAYSEVGTFEGKSGCKIVILACESSVRNFKCYAIKFEAIDGFSCYVDSDEISRLITGIDSLLKLDKTATKLDRFEASYTTRDSLRFYRADFLSPDIKDRIQISNAGGGYQAYDLDELTKIKELIQKAQDTLKSLESSKGPAATD